MKRLLPRPELAKLVALVERHKDQEPFLHQWLTMAYEANGGSTLYPVQKDGAIAGQYHLRDFD